MSAIVTCTRWRLGPGVERHVVAAGLQPLDLAGGHHQDPVAVADEDAAQVAALVERVPQALAVGEVRRRLEPLPGALDRGLEALSSKGLRR